MCIKKGDSLHVYDFKNYLNYSDEGMTINQDDHLARNAWSVPWSWEELRQLASMKEDHDKECVRISRHRYVWMTSTCPKSASPEVMSKCEHSSPEVLDSSTWPRVNLDGGKMTVYKNAHCAFCNGVGSEGVCVLHLGFSCPKGTDLKEIMNDLDENAFVNFAVNQCSLLFSPAYKRAPKYRDAMERMADLSCFIDPSTTPSDYDNTPIEVIDQRMCDAFLHPIIQNGVMYKNPLCLTPGSLTPGSLMEGTLNAENTYCVDRSKHFVTDNADPEFGFGSQLSLSMLLDVSDSRKYIFGTDNELFCRVRGRKFDCKKWCEFDQFQYDGLCYPIYGHFSKEKDFQVLVSIQNFEDYDFYHFLEESFNETRKSIYPELEWAWEEFTAPCDTFQYLYFPSQIVLDKDLTCLNMAVMSNFLRQGFLRESLAILRNFSLINKTLHNPEDIAIFKNFYEEEFIDCGNGTLFKFDDPLITQTGIYIDVGQGHLYDESVVNWMAWTKPLSNQVNYSVWVCVMDAQLCLHPAHISHKNLRELMTKHPDILIMYYDYQADRNIICLDGLKNFTSSHLLGGSDDNSVLNLLTIIGNSISITALFATIVIYISVPHLHNRAGTLLINYMVALALAQVLFQINDDFAQYDLLCQLMGGFQHFFWLVTFSFLNLTSIDMAKTFKSLQLVMETCCSRQTINYVILGWLIPAMLVTPCVVLSVMDSELFKYGNGLTCWIGSPQLILYTFAIPILLCIALNIACFLVSVIELRKHTRQFQQASSKSKQFSINLKLFSLTGFSWLFGFLPNVVNIRGLWYPFIILNTLQGLFVFLAFGMSKRVRLMMLSRCSDSLIERNTESDKSQDGMPNTTAIACASVLNSVNVTGLSSVH